MDRLPDADYRVHRMVSFVRELTSRIFGRRSRFFKNVTLLMGSTAIAQLVSLALTPILTRLYTPAEYGVLTVYLAVLGLFTRGGTLNYEYVIPIADDDESAFHILVLCIVLTAAISTVVGAAMIPLRGVLSRIERIAALIPYLWVVPLSFLFVGSYNAFSLWAVRSNNFRRLARTKISQSATQGITQVGLGLLKLSSLGLLVGDVLGKAAGIGNLVRDTLRKDGALLKTIRIRRLRALAMRYKSYPLVQTPASLLINAGTQLVPLLLAFLYSESVAGYFNLTQRIIGAPITLVSQSLKQGFFAEMSIWLKKDPAKIKSLFRRLNLQLMLIGIAPCAVLTAFGGPIFSFVFGPQWLQAGRYAQVLTLSFLLKFSSDSFISLALLEKNFLSMTWSVIRLTLTVGGLYLASSLQYDDFLAVAIYGASMVAAYGLNYVFFIVSLNRIITRRGQNPAEALPSVGSAAVPHPSTTPPREPDPPTG